MAEEVNVLSPDELDVQVGDRVRVVVQATGSEGDPVAYINGRLTIIHADEAPEQPSFGETVSVKIADVRSNSIHAVYTGE